MNNKQNGNTVVEEKSALAKELLALGLTMDDSELTPEKEGASLKTHNGEMFVTKDGRVHLVFDAIPYEHLTDYTNKTGQVTARRIALKFKSQTGAPIKVPVDFETSEGETVRGYYMMRTANIGAVSLYPITAKK